MEMAYLGIKVDSSGVPKASGDLDRFTGAATRASNAGERLDRTGRLIRGTFMALGFTGAIVGLKRLSDSYTQMQNLLGVISRDQEHANSTLEQLRVIAMRTRSPLAEMAQLYQRVAMASHDLGANQTQTIKFIENIGLALATAGSGAHRATGALLQLSQAMGGGIVRAEEFNSIQEGAYPIALAAARGIDRMGGSVTKLRQEVVAGTVTSKEFFEAILSQSDQLAETFAKTEATIDQAIINLNSSLISFLGTFNEITGASSGVANGILWISQNLDQLVYTAGAAVAVVGVRYVGAMALAYASTMTLTGALALLQAALLKVGFLALVVGAGYLVERFMQLVEGAGSFGNAMSLLKDVAVETMDRIDKALESVVFAAEGAGAGIQAAFLGSFASVAEGALGMAQSVADTLNSIPGMDGVFKPRDWITNAATGLRADANRASQVSADSFSQAKYGISDGPGGAGEALSSLEALREALNSTAASATNLNEEATSAIAALDSDGSGTKGSASKLSKAKDEADAAREAMERLREEQQRVEEQNAFVADSFSSLAKSARQGIDGVKDAVSSLLGRLADLAMDNFFQQMVSGGGGSFGGLGGVLGSVFGIGAAPAIPAYAGGTNFHPGGLARVNDGGRGEVIHLPRGSSVDPNYPRQQESKTVNINISLDGAKGDQHLYAVAMQAVSAGLSNAQEVFAGSVVAVNRDPRKAS